MKKIIVDTNWWISFILSTRPGCLPDFFLSPEVDLYFSSELLAEINSTLSYARASKRINKLNMQSFLDFIDESAVVIDVSSKLEVCRDPKDNFLLALAKDAGADFLITKDEDLL